MLFQKLEISECVSNKIRAYCEKKNYDCKLKNEKNRKRNREKIKMKIIEIRVK